MAKPVPPPHTFRVHFSGDAPFTLDTGAARFPIRAERPCLMDEPTWVFLTRTDHTDRALARQSRSLRRHLELGTVTLVGAPAHLSSPPAADVSAVPRGDASAEDLDDASGLGPARPLDTVHAKLSIPIGEPSSPPGDDAPSTTAPRRRSR